MRALLDRLKRERRWAVALFIAAGVLIFLVQNYVLSPDAEPAAPVATAETSG